MSQKPNDEIKPGFFDIASITKPADEIVRFGILQRRFDLIEALDMAEKESQVWDNDMLPFGVVIARLKTLFRELKPILKRKWDTDKFSAFEKKISELRQTRQNEVIECSDILIDFIDEIGLTKVDTFKPTTKKALEE